jgi:RCC1 and BTB domain-containing protein
MYGKLGHGNEAGCSTPKRVEGLAGLQVAHIALGSRHSVIVTSTGATYSWGDMENGVAGHGAVEGHQCVPRLVERLAGKRIVQISACGFHTACLSNAGEVFTWGEGMSMEILGTSSGDHEYHSPVCLDVT